MQRLTSSPAPSIILTREVRWHARLPYGYPHFSSSRGKRARWRAETNIVSCTFLPSGDSESGGRRRYLVVIRAFRQPRGTNSTVSGWCWSFGANPFQNFCRFFTLVVWKHSRPTTREILLCWEGTIECNGDGKCHGCPTLSFPGHGSLLMLLMPFLCFLNDRFRWQGYWSAEWCSAQTKLVSYLYFAFISNKR